MNLAQKRKSQEHKVFSTWCVSQREGGCQWGERGCEKKMGR